MKIRYFCIAFIGKLASNQKKLIQFAINVVYKLRTGDILLVKALQK